MARYKPRRQKRYEELINKFHFLPAEAIELSQIKKHVPPEGGSSVYPPAMRAMQRSRLAAWANYKRWVGKESWLELTTVELAREWRRRVLRVYEKRHLKSKTDKKTGATTSVLDDWIVRKDVHGKRIGPTISVWEYYDWLFQRLSEQDRWDTPRSHRTGQPEVKIDRVLKQRWVSDLQKAIKASQSRERKEQLQQQMDNLRRSQ